MSYPHPANENRLLLNESETRAIINMLSDIAVMDEPVANKKRRVMETLSFLVKADCWIWTFTEPTRPKENISPIKLIHGGYDEQRFAAYALATEHPFMVNLNAVLVKALHENKSHTTLTREQLDPEDTFPDSPVYPLWKKANISQLILSSHPFTDGSNSLVGLYRDWDSEPFTPREAQITHMILTEIPWLHKEAWPTKQITSILPLSPRLRATLSLLLQGLDRKRISTHLDISENTVSGYIKNIYRHYDVHSHAELILQFQDEN